MSLPATVPQAEIAALRMAWAKDPQDLGLGMYRPSTGEIHIASYDETGRTGHDGLQHFLGIPDAERPEWRGFIFPLPVWPSITLVSTTPMAAFECVRITLPRFRMH
jgi:hypothetical protein